MTTLTDERLRDLRDRITGGLVRIDKMHDAGTIVDAIDQLLALRGREGGGTPAGFGGDYEGQDARGIEGSGICSGCGGTGRSRSDLTVTRDGTYYSECEACGGEGRALSAASPAPQVAETWHELVELLNAKIIAASPGYKEALLEINTALSQPVAESQGVDAKDAARYRWFCAQPYPDDIADDATKWNDFKAALDEFADKALAK